MENVSLSVKDDKLTITIDLSKRGRDSESGKSRVIATTRGNVDVPGKVGLKLGLNLYAKK